MGFTGMSGWLMKRGRFITKFRRRFCKLRAGVVDGEDQLALTYYKVRCLRIFTCMLVSTRVKCNKKLEKTRRINDRGILEEKLLSLLTLWLLSAIVMGHRATNSTSILQNEGVNVVCICVYF